jgi:type II secretory pathway pseudopilin PulG
MNAPARRRAAGAAFTLLELLVVIGLMAALSVSLVRGFASTSGVELRQAESALAAQLVLARSTAIRRARPARLAVGLDAADAEQRLALVAVLVRDANSAWVLASEPLRLGAHVRVVPEAAVPTAGAPWPANGVSRWTGTVTTPAAGLPSGNYGYIEFSATGGTFGNPKLVCATIVRRPDGIAFQSPDQIRCFLVRGSGTATLLKEAASIP